ncbi:hypothetical protein [Metabacillus fastidiosus]|uniref:hypothetical protein n=1 Tax=Metabacillus fastidiosus TaxID=1458 RepID=UPI002DB8E054|nr:hypothetical protein [Metabacillus fastidiosus]MEC2077028.1 hypothetical protein [Metabacillus fastidiosus]
MKWKPEYAANIIVGINYKNRFSWYVTDKDYWILDLIKRRDDFLRNGHEYDLDHMLMSRMHIEVINEYTAERYLAALNEHKVKSIELRKLVEKKDYEDTILSLYPSLFIDFDNRRLLSSFPETLPFERYVPSGWVGEYKPFDEYIPEQDKYWIADGIDLINEAYQREAKEFMEEQGE